MYKNSAKHNIVILACVACVAIMFTLQEAQPVPIERFEAIRVLGILCAFLIIALLVERCVEVVITYLFIPRKNTILAEATKHLSHLQAHNDSLRSALNLVSTPHERLEVLGSGLSAESTHIRRKAEESYSISRQQLLLLKTPKTLTAVTTALVLGSSICISGFRVLHSLSCAFSLGDCRAVVTSPLFEVTDIAIGTLLIAGGAEGIHRLIKRIGGQNDFFALSLASGNQALQH